MKVLTSDEPEEPATPRSGANAHKLRERAEYLDDVLTSEDILQSKYAELGELLAAQVVERKALSCLGTVFSNKKPKRSKRHGRSSSRKNAKMDAATSRWGTSTRPSSATSSQYTDSRYDSDLTDFTEASGTTCSSAANKRVSFADDVMSCGSSVVITEITEDETELEDRINRRPRVSLNEEEMEAAEIRDSSRKGSSEEEAEVGMDRASVEKELLRGILRGSRPRSARGGNMSPSPRSSRPTTPRATSPKRQRSPKRSVNLTTSREEEKPYLSNSNRRQSSGNNERKSPRRKRSPRRKASANNGSKTPRSKSPRKKKVEKDDEEAPAAEPESPRIRESPDNDLRDTQNKHLRAWLRKKDIALRKQKKEERRKEKEKAEAVEEKRQELKERVTDGEARYKEWMKEKKRCEQLSISVARKVLKDAEKIENERLTATLRAVESENRPAAPVGGNSPDGDPKTVDDESGDGNTTTTKKPRKSKPKITSTYAFRKTLPKVVPVTTHDNRIGIVRDFTGDWTGSVTRDLATEREIDEEKRQSKEAKKRELLVKKAKKEEQKRLKSEAPPKPKRSFPRGTSNAAKTKPNRTDDKLNTSSTPGLNSANKRPQQPQRPSTANPMRGVTYDEWVNQKIKRDKDRREYIKSGVKDPELEDLIPLLAKHRIDRATEPAKRVDTGLRNRPKSSAPGQRSSSGKNADEDAAKKQGRDSAWRSFPKSSNSFLNVKTPTPPNTPLSGGRKPTGGKMSSDSSMDIDDLINSVRPEPQGCEITTTSHCQTSSSSLVDAKPNVFITEAVS